MSCNDDVQPWPIGGLDWWNMQRQRLAGTLQSTLFFRVAPHAYRLLAEGQPVNLERLAAAAAVPLQEVEAALHEQRGTDWDDQGRLVGFGLTLRPTPHRFSFDGRSVFAWCASDALMIPVITGRSGVVESPCPATGQLITVEVTPEHVHRVDPPGAVVSLVRPEKIEDVRTDVCVLGSFFATAEAATDWLAAYPEGMVHSVEDDFRLHREVMEKIGWALATSSIR